MTLTARLRRLALDERGSEPIAFIGATLIVVMAIALVVLSARIGTTNTAVAGAAQAGARAATLTRDAPAAIAAAEAAVASNLEQNGIRCTALTVSVDASELALPLGQTGIVGVDVACTISLVDIDLGVPAGTTVNGTGSSPTNPYSER